MSDTASLVCLGNPLLDCEVHADVNFLKKYDLEANNAILADAKHADLVEDMCASYKSTVRYSPGGAGLNSCRIAAQLIKANPTMKKQAVVYLGSIGKDETAEILKKKVSESNIDGIFYEHPSEKTGTCAAIITSTFDEVKKCEESACRSLVAYVDAAGKFNAEHIEVPEHWAAVTNSAMCYQAGFFIASSFDACLKVAKHFCLAGKPYIFNISATFLAQFFLQQVCDILAHADFVIANEDEAAMWGEAMGFGGSSDLKAVARATAAYRNERKGGARTVIFTRGPQSTFVAIKPAGDNAEIVIKEFEVPAVAQCEVIDTNGAGDAFVGGFLSRLQHSIAANEPFSLEDALRCGTLLAQLCIRQHGCTLPQRDFQPADWSETGRFV